MSRMGNEFIRMKEAGEIPYDTSVEDMIPVKCHRCKWEGYTPQLKQGCCPACHSDQYLETRDLVYELITLAYWRNLKQHALEQVIGYERDIPF